MSRVTPRLPGFSVSLLLVKAEPAYSSTPFLRGCLLASRPPEGCGERPINGLHVSNNQCPPAGGERSVVINGGYSLGIACRIDPSLQAICNSDSAKLTVNRRCGLIRSEEHTSELQSRPHLVCRLLLEKKKRECYFFRVGLAQP